MTLQWNVATADDGSESITALIDGEWLLAEKTHPNHQELLNALVNRLTGGNEADEAYRTDEQIRDLFDLSFKIGQKFENLDVSERARVSNGKIYWDGIEIDNSLTQQILRFVEAGVDDWKPLLRFWEKLATNPNENSQEFLFDWLNADEHNPFTISEDGDIIAYKGLREDYTSVTAGPAIVNGEWMEGHVPNNPGNVIELPRDQVIHDPAQTCSFGLHAATFAFARAFTRGPVVSLKINPRDVVSVPVAAHGAKMRVRLYTVLEEVEGPIAEPVYYYDVDEEIEDDESETTEELVEEAHSAFGRLLARLRGDR